jgi:four helix bundle protein
MNIYQSKLLELEDRMLSFSVTVIKICDKYRNDKLLYSVIDQLIRSATSIGANYAEANNASSRLDFRNKIFIAKKEAGETRYWLRVLAEVLPKENFSRISQEALELNLILQKIVTTMKTVK